MMQMLTERVFDQSEVSNEIYNKMFMKVVGKGASECLKCRQEAQNELPSTLTTSYDLLEATLLIGLRKSKVLPFPALNSSLPSDFSLVPPPYVRML
jgi:hypothetical protein